LLAASVDFADRPRRGRRAAQSNLWREAWPRASL